MRKNISKYLSRFVIIYQGMAILATTINLIFDFITCNTYAFPISYISWFVPEYYLAVGGNLWNLFPLAILIGITLFLFVKSSKILLSEDVEQYKYPTLNGCWLGINQLSYMQFFCFNLATHGEPPYCSMANLSINMAFLIIYLINLFMKFNYNEVFVNNRTTKSYVKLKEYAWLNVKVSIFIAFWNIWMHYFSDTSISNPDHRSMIMLDIDMLVSFGLFYIIILCYVIFNFFKVKVLDSYNIPDNHPLLRLYLLQIAAMPFEMSGFKPINSEKYKATVGIQQKINIGVGTYLGVDASFGVGFDYGYFFDQLDEVWR